MQQHRPLKRRSRHQMSITRIHKEVCLFSCCSCSCSCSCSFSGSESKSESSYSCSRCLVWRVSFGSLCSILMFCTSLSLSDSLSLSLSLDRFKFTSLALNPEIGSFRLSSLFISPFKSLSSSQTATQTKRSGSLQFRLERSCCRPYWQQ